MAALQYADMYTMKATQKDDPEDNPLVRVIKNLMERVNELEKKVQILESEHYRDDATNIQL